MVFAYLHEIQDEFKLTADDYSSKCVHVVKGFKYAILSNEGSEDLSEVVGFFMEIPPARLVEGGGGEDEGENQNGLWRSLLVRCVVLGFCLLGKLERAASALYRSHLFPEIRSMKNLRMGQLSRERRARPDPSPTNS